jgi:hypothetical protein
MKTGLFSIIKIAVISPTINKNQGGSGASFTGIGQCCSKETKQQNNKTTKQQKNILD